MKTFAATLAKALLLTALTVSTFNIASAQSTRQEKKAEKETEVKNLVDSKSYVFIAQYAQSQYGLDRYLTSEYDFRVGADSLIAFLPYFGRAYVAPIYPLDDGGMKFTTTQFDYVTTEKKDSWDITIKPKNARDVNVMYMHISKDGYASLSINSLNRDPITYQGYIEAKKQKV